MIQGSSEIECINVYKAQWDSWMKKMFIMLSCHIAKISLGEIEGFFPVLEKERMGLLAYFKA